MKKLINSEKEYREYAFPICQKWYGRVDEYYGLELTWECYDEDENGNVLDENGNIIPEDTPYNVKVEDWVKKLKYPLFVIDWIELESDGGGVIFVDFVSIHDFPH